MRETKWSRRPIGELFEIGAGKTMSAAARHGAEKVPFLRTSNVLWDEIDLSTVDEMSMSDEELAEKSVHPGDLLVCEGGEIGRAAVWNGEADVMSFQNHLHRLRPSRSDVEPRFYVYFLQCAFTQLGIFEGAGNKTTIPNLSRNRLAALEVPHPDLSEQQEITAVLARVRHGIKTHISRVDTAQELKRAVMCELFTSGLRGEPRKGSEVGLVPESWLISSIGTHFSVVSGGTPSRAIPNFWKEGTIPWVKTGEVDYNIVTDTKEHITAAGLASLGGKLLLPGTLLLAMYGQGVTRGKVAMLGVEAACNQACAAIRPVDDCVEASYLYHFLAFRYETIRQLAHGGQQQNLNLDIVREIPVVFPANLDEQRQIVEILDAIDRKIELHRKQHQILEELFKALLHQLMTCEIRVADLDLSALDELESAPRSRGGAHSIRALT